jgi:hypothetical protein
VCWSHLYDQVAYRKATEASAENSYPTSESLESKLGKVHVGEPATGHATNTDDVSAEENVVVQDTTEENYDPLPVLPSVQIEKDDSELEEEFFFTTQMFLMEIYDVGTEVLIAWMD